MSIRTINEVFYRGIERNLECAVLFKRSQKWVPISSREFYRNVLGVAYAMREWGLRPGDRVAILSENRPEWAVIDYAAMLIGAASVPIYTTLTPEQTLYVLRDSGARVIFLSNADQFEKFCGISDQCAVEKVVIMDEVDAPAAIHMPDLMRSGPEQRDEAFDARALAVGPDELATIIYTSGTTGTPKGAMLTQGNLASNLLHSLDLYNFRPGQTIVSFLPLAHVTARHVDYVMFWHGVTIAYCPSFDGLLETLRQVRPQFFVAVPRVYEKICNQVQNNARTGLKHKFYKWAIGVGSAHKDEIFAGGVPTDWQWRAANAIFFSKVRAALGGRVEFFISGGAPLGRDLLDWYASIGIRIHEGYGLTETSPLVALNTARFYRPGSVGRVLKNVEVQIAPDNEILVKAPSVFKGYWNMPQETETAFEGDWFHTGDVGHLDGDGFLYVTDRKKDLIKTSGGKFIAPQPIESKLKTNTLIAEVAIIADRRKFPSAVIAPDFTALEYWAAQNRIAFETREQLVGNDQVFKLYEEALAEVNRELAQFERIKKFIIVAEEFSIAGGTLTPTMKLKRRIVEERYRQRLDELYNNEAKAKAG
jgi:long-chain acyl-CoA synthetase